MGRINAPSWEYRLESLSEDLQLTEFQVKVLTNLVDALIAEAKDEQHELDLERFK